MVRAEQRSALFAVRSMQSFVPRSSSLRLDSDIKGIADESLDVSISGFTQHDFFLRLRSIFK